MYDLRLDRKLTQALFSRWDKETKDWVVNAIASLVVVDQVVEQVAVMRILEVITTDHKAAVRVSSLLPIREGRV